MQKIALSQLSSDPLNVRKEHKNQAKMPSVKMLCAIARDLTPKGARAIRTVINGDTDAINPIRQTYLPNKFTRIGNGHYSFIERAELLNTILECHGIEYIHPKGDHSEPPIAAYCNTGDMYCPTLCYYKHEWRIMDEETLRNKCNA
jgi:hypothetical protein